jgi:molecular chaperone GrpE (heat shock protein)
LTGFAIWALRSQADFENYKKRLLAKRKTRLIQRIAALFQAAGGD